MRVWSRIALVVVSLFLASASQAATCPLSLAGQTPPATDFELSPHGIFRSGALVYALRGQILTTYTTNDVGNLQVAREDFIGSLAGRDSEGGVAFANGFLYVSTEAGLEIFDLRNVRAGGSAPVLVHRAPGFRYERLTVSGNRLAGLRPTSTLPCYPSPDNRINCQNQIDLLDITTLTNPFVIGAIRSYPNLRLRGLNDIAFHGGSLVAVSEESLMAFNITNPAAPSLFALEDRPGRWLVSNGNDFLAVGNDTYWDIYNVTPGMSPFFTRTSLLALPLYLGIDRANELRFSQNAFWDESTARFITIIDEVDPMTLDAARTIAFDVFDFRVPHFEGSAERVYEDVTILTDDDVKHDPVSVGNYVYVLGEETGLQTYGSCGVASGRIELDSIAHLLCGGTEIHGWVTGQNRIVNVELFLDNTTLGAATLGGSPRSEVSSPFPVTPWRVSVNLDQTVAGEHTLRAIATDALGVRRQFAIKPLYFGGPGKNCTVPVRRRSVGR
jgi:hypothetical protein